MTLGTTRHTVDKMVTATTRRLHALLRPETLGLLVMVLAPVQYLLNIAFVFIQPEQPLTDPNSLYAVGRLGWLWQFGAIAAGLGLVAAALGLGQSLARGKRVRLGVTLVLIAGIAVIGTGVFPTDAPVDVETVGFTTTGALHLIFGLVGFLSIIVMLFVLKGVFKRDPRWARASQLTAWLAWLVLVGVPASIVLEGTTAGVVLRFVDPLVPWALWIGWLLRRLGRPNPQREVAITPR